MRFLTTNLCTENATVVTSSSANVNFPVSNLKNPFRSKRWRSSGTFVVDLSNNKIDFKDTGGGLEKTATLSLGTYSVSGLKTEIESKMASVGSHTYTVQYSTSTGLWTLSSNGSYFSLLNLTGTNNSLSILNKSLGFPAADKTGSLSYTGSLVACHTKESVVFDLQTIQDISSIVILWPKEDGIRLSDDAILKIEANATNSWSGPAVSQILTIDNDYLVASHFFSSVQTYRYWRVTVEDPKNSNLFVELGMVWIGENIEFNEPQNGFKINVSDTSTVSRTDFGHEYVDEYPNVVSLEFGYSYIGYSTAQIMENAFRQNGVRKPVLIVFDETEQVFNKDHFLIYGKFDKDFALNHVMYDMFNGVVKITELG